MSYGRALARQDKSTTRIFKPNLENTNPLPAVSVIKSDQVRRTIYLGNLRSGLQESQVRAFFSGVGDVRYIKMIRADDNRSYAFIEFNDVGAANRSFALHGAKLASRPVHIGRANNPIAGTGVQDILANPLKLSQAKLHAQIALNNIEAKKRQRSTSKDWETKRNRKKRARSRSVSRSPARERRRARTPSRERRRSRRRGSRDDGRNRNPRRSSKSRSRKKSCNMFWDGFHWHPKQVLPEGDKSKEGQNGPTDPKSSNKDGYSQSRRSSRSSR